MLQFLLTWALTMVLITSVDVLVARITQNRVTGFKASLCLTPLISAGLTLWLSEDADLYYFLITLGIALMWWFIYLNIAQSLESSLRIKILFEIFERGGRMKVNELKEIYNDTRLINIRIDRLKKHKAIHSFDGKLFLSSTKLKIAASFFLFLKQAILRQSSQFDN
ncbi:hypothetical protein [Sneathiella glossodoripedis]|uniref:hypothetical protein n=1 Tax=Sneathiella glossodoripedis TaxID=418853 RepID=UPI0004703B0B|nr:hypothetical protein [Sneathiella glossodoripedis]